MKSLLEKTTILTFFNITSPFTNLIDSVIFMNSIYKTLIFSIFQLMRQFIIHTYNTFRGISQFVRGFGNRIHTTGAKNCR